MSHRNYLPGIDWLYFKIYCGYKTSDEILTQIIHPFSTHLKDDEIAQKWFFIRYSDPHYHIRYRIRLNDSYNSGKIIYEFSNLLKPYFDQGLIWNVKLDTYNREIERYGEKTIDLCEELFMLDSCMIVQSINLLDKFEDTDEMRWLWGFLILDSYINDVDKGLDWKMEFINYSKDLYTNEFDKDNRLKVNFDIKFRNYRRKLTDTISGSLFDNEFQNLLSIKSTATKPIIGKILEILPPTYDKNIVGSLNHMMINRLFRTKQRLNEFALYHLIHRYHISEIARNKHTTKNLSKINI